MATFAELEAQPPPRPDALCHAFRGSIDPAFGFVAYGVLFFFFAGTPGVAILMMVIRFGGAHPPQWLVWTALAQWPVTYVAMWLLFARWVRDRRALERRLFREGTIEDATIEDVVRMTFKGSPMTRATARTASGRRVTMTVGGHPPDIDFGVAVRVLTTAGYSYGLASYRGGSIVAKVM